MKTTIKISKRLLREARETAARGRTTLRALVEQGLRRIVGEKRRGSVFRLRKASFRGRGLRADLLSTEWERIRELAYTGGD